MHTHPNAVNADLVLFHSLGCLQ